MPLLLETIVLLLIAFGIGLFLGSLVWKQRADRS